MRFISATDSAEQKSYVTSKNAFKYEHKCSCLLFHQLDSLEKERANLATLCEDLRLSHQQKMENTQDMETSPERAADSFIQSDPKEAGGTGFDTLRRSGSYLLSHSQSCFRVSPLLFLSGLLNFGRTLGVFSSPTCRI